MGLESLKKRLESVITAEEHMKNGGITPDDVVIIIEELNKSKWNIERTIREIKQNLDADKEYMETHRGTKR